MKSNLELHNIIVRESTIEDIDKIYNLSTLCFSNSWNYNSFESDFNNIFSKYISLIYCNKLIGFLTSIIVMEEVTITNIAISKEYRGNGLSKYLLEYLINLYPNFEFFLEVRESNEVAINLYKSFNFKEISIRLNYYTNPKENALIMKKF